MGKRGRRGAKQSAAIAAMASVLVAAAASDNLAKGLTADGAHDSRLGFLGPPDPPVDDTKTAEEQIADLEVHRDMLAHDGHDDLANAVQGKIDLLRGTPKKKKRRSGLDLLVGTTKRQEERSHVTLSHGGKGSFLAGDRAKGDPWELHAARSTKAKKAAAASWEGYAEWKKTGVEVDLKNGAILTVAWERGDKGGASSSTSPLGGGMSNARKYAIQYLYVEQFGTAPEEEWGEGEFHPTSSLPTLIMRLLNIPDGSRASVVKAMRDIHEAHEAGELYDPSKDVKGGRGRKALIEDMTPQAHVVYRSMGSGLSLGNTVILVNQWRRVRSMEPLSYGALQRFVSESTVLVLEKRATKKSGKADKTTNWAVARLAFCRQLLRQLMKALRISDAAHGTRNGSTYVAAQDGDDEQQADLELPLHVDGIGYWDEHHREIRLGHSSKYEARVRQDEHGNYSPTGTLPAKKPTTNVKYPDEARGCFGCCIRTSRLGEKVGMRMPVFNYTGQWLHGAKRWNEEFEKERLRVLDMPRKFGGGGPWVRARAGRGSDPDRHWQSAP